MADWHTPSQVLKGLQSQWAKFDRGPVCPPQIKEIKEEDLLNYYNTKQLIKQKGQYDSYFDTNQYYDQKVTKDTMRSEREIHDNIYNEELLRPVPLLSSHECGHRFTDLEGKALHNHKRAETKSDFRRTGLPLDPNVGLPKTSYDIFDE